MNDTSECRACGRKIKFVKTSKGNFMPVDFGFEHVVEDALGPTTIITETGVVIRGTRVEPGSGYRTTRGWVPHFVTCPNADQFRKKKKG